jgi:hypothetical protein
MLHALDLIRTFAFALTPRSGIRLSTALDPTLQVVRTEPRL